VLALGYCCDFEHAVSTFLVVDLDENIMILFSLWFSILTFQLSLLGLSSLSHWFKLYEGKRENFSTEISSCPQPKL